MLNTKPLSLQTHPALDDAFSPSRHHSHAWKLLPRSGQNPHPPGLTLSGTPPQTASRADGGIREYDTRSIDRLAAVQTWFRYVASLGLITCAPAHHAFAAPLPATGSQVGLTSRSSLSRHMSVFAYLFEDEEPPSKAKDAASVKHVDPGQPAKPSPAQPPPSQAEPPGKKQRSQAKTPKARSPAGRKQKKPSGAKGSPSTPPLSAEQACPAPPAASAEQCSKQAPTAAQEVAETASASAEQLLGELLEADAGYPDAVPLSSAAALQAELGSLLGRTDHVITWESQTQQLALSQGHTGTVTYTADASVVHAWLLHHVLAPGVHLLGLDAEWSTSAPSLQVLQLATAKGVLVFHASPAMRRDASSPLYAGKTDRWLAHAVTAAFSAWEDAAKAGGAFTAPPLQVGEAERAALQEAFGEAEAPWTPATPSENATALEWCDGGEADVVNEAGVPSGLLALLRVLGHSGKASLPADGTAAEMEAAVLAAPRVVGVGVEGDADLVATAWGVPVPGTVDGGTLGAAVGGEKGLARLSRHLLGATSWKSRGVHRIKAWGSAPLPQRLLTYAARDALFSRLIADAALSAARSAAPAHPQAREWTLHGTGTPWEKATSASSLLQDFAYLQSPGVFSAHAAAR